MAYQPISGQRLAPGPAWVDYSTIRTFPALEEKSSWFEQNIIDPMRSFGAGANSMLAGAGWVAERLGAQDFGSAIQEFAKNGVDYWNSQLTPETQAALQKDLFDVTDKGIDFNFTKLVNGIASSAPSFVVGLGAGGALAKGLQMFANPLGRGILVNSIKAGEGAAEGSLAFVKAAEAAKSLQLVDKIIFGAGYGGSEGAMAGAAVGAEVSQTIKGMSHDALMERSERYQMLYDSYAGEDEDRRQQLAKGALADEASTDAAWKSGTLTAALGAGAGAFYGRILGPSSTRAFLQAEKIAGMRGGRAVTAAAGFGEEALAEGLQSANEQLFTNLGIAKADDTVDPLKDVGEQALEGAVIGGVMGGATGGLVGGGEIEQEARHLQWTEEARKGDEKLQATLESISQQGLDDHANAILEVAKERGQLKTMSDLDYLAEHGELREDTWAELFGDEQDNQDVTGEGGDGEGGSDGSDPTAAVYAAKDRDSYVAAVHALVQSLPDGSTVTDGETGLTYAVKHSVNEKTGARHVEFGVVGGKGENDVTFTTKADGSVKVSGDVYFPGKGRATIVPASAERVTPATVKESLTVAAAKPKAELAAEDPGLEDALRQERDAYTNERDDAYLNKTKHARDPLKDAVEDAVNASVLDPDAARVVLDVALSNGRVDLAEYAVSRAERAVAGMSVTPGVPQNSPKYADIKAALESRKREATALLDSLKKDLAAAKTATVRESLTVGTVAAENEQQERERGNINEQARTARELRSKPDAGAVPWADYAGGMGASDRSAGQRPAGAAGGEVPGQAGDSGQAQEVKPAGAAMAPASGDIRFKLAEAAHAAATSPKNDLPQPTEKQIHAGNYTLGHARVRGLDVSIENPAGSDRVLTKRAGTIAMKDHYGYIRGLRGADGDHLDVFMSDDAHDESRPIFVAEQLTPDGKFDEHKVYMGYQDEKAVRSSFLAHQQLKPAMRMAPKLHKFTDVGAFKQWAQEQEHARVAASKGFEIQTDKEGRLRVRGDLQKARKLATDAGVLNRGSIRRDERGEYLEFTPTAATAAKAAILGLESKASRTGHVVAHQKTKSGTLVGAPAKYDTEARMKPLRALLKKLALEGEPGRFWYEQSSQDVMDFVGGNVDDADLFAKLLAIYSPQAKVDSNTTFAIKAYYQIKAGLPVQVKTAAQDRKAQAAADGAPLREWMGEKTNNFYLNLMLRIDPKRVAGLQGATIDMWMMRAFEYASDAPTATQYKFAEIETNRLARELGWEPQQVQAAIWVAMKARTENKGVKDLTEDESEKAGDMKWVEQVDEESGRTKKVRDFPDDKAAARHRLRWLKNALAHVPSADDTAGAGFHFGDGLRAHVSQLSWEAVPSTDVQELSWIHKNMLAKLELQARVSDVIGDRILRAMGLMTDGPVVGMGGWKGAVSPSAQERVVAGSVVYKDADGNTGLRDVSPQIAERMNVASAIYAYLLKQDGVAWHRPMYDDSGLVSNGIHLEFGRSLTPEETLSAYNAVTEEMMKTFGVSKEVAQMIAPIPHETGVRFVNFPDGEGGFTINTADLQREKAAARAKETAGIAERSKAKNARIQADESASVEDKEKAARRAKQTAKDAANAAEALKTAGETPDHKLFVAAVERAIESTNLPDPHSRSFRSVGDFVGNNWKEDPSGENLVKRATDAGFGDQFRRVVDDLQPKIAAVHAAIEEKYGPKPAVKPDGRAFSLRSSERSTGRGSAVPGRVRGQPAKAGVAPPPPAGVPAFAANRVQPDAVHAVGLHFSPVAGLKALDPTKAGTAFAGAERRRFGPGNFGKDSPRLNFYVDSGGARERALAGAGNAYTVQLNNLYDISADPRGLHAKAGMNVDYLEEMVSEEGFDGILYPAVAGIPSKTAVVFGFKRSVPVAPAQSSDKMFALGSKPELPGKFSKQAVDGLISLLSWHGKDKIRVYETEAEVPGLHDHLRLSGQLEKMGRVQGFYDPGTKSVVIVAENIRSPEEAYRTIVEEHLRHQGMRQFFGADKLNPFLDNIYSSLPHDKMRDLAIQYGSKEKPVDLTTAEGRRLVAEEYLAKIKSVQEKSPLMARVGDFFRGALRQFGFKMKYSNRDVIHILQQIEDGVRSGRFASPAWNGKGIDPVAPAFSLTGESDRWYYSALERSITEGKGAPKRAGATQWKQWLDGAQRRGEFKQAEREWLGVDEWLDGRGDTSRAEIEQFIAENKVEISETVLSRPSQDDWDPDDGLIGNTRYGNYQLPGGKNYRELLLTLPEVRDTEYEKLRDELMRMQSDALDAGRDVESSQKYAALKAQMQSASKTHIQGKDKYKSSHFDQPNILAHVRFNERTDADGKRVLFVEEVQSDWHQSGRKRGYSGAKTETVYVVEYWQDGRLASVAQFPTRERAEKQAEESRKNPARSASIKEHRWEVVPKDVPSESSGKVPDAPLKKEWPLAAMKRMIRWAAENGFDKIAWTTGKQQANRYISGGKEDETRRSGMSAFYDKMLASELKDYSKKFGSSVSVSNVVGIPARQVSGDVTPEKLRDAAKSSGDTLVKQHLSAYADAIEKGSMSVDDVAERMLPIVQKAAGVSVANVNQSPQLSIEITPAMRTAALAGQPLFRLRSLAGTQAQEAAGDKVQLQRPYEMSLGDRFRTILRDVVDGWKHMWSLDVEQSLFDAGASIKAWEKQISGRLLDASQSAGKMYDLAKNPAAVIAGVMRLGVPKLVNGSFQAVAGRRGLVDIFRPLYETADGTNHVRLWERYAIAKRSSRLIQEQNRDGTSKEKRLTQQEIDELLQLEVQHPHFKTVFDNWQTFNNELLDFAVENGVLSQATRNMWSQNDYVPFYRVMEDLAEQASGNGGTRRSFSGRNVKSKRLTGADAAIEPVMESIIKNSAYILDSVYKNETQKRTVEMLVGHAMTKAPMSFVPVKFKAGQIETALKNAGIVMLSERNVVPSVQAGGRGYKAQLSQLTKTELDAYNTMFQMVAPTGANIISVMKNGKAEYYHVDDPLVLRSIQAIGPQSMSNLMRLMSGSKQLLTNAVTADPGFMLVNFLRDTISAWVTSDAPFKPVLDGVKGAIASMRDDPIKWQLQIAGASLGGHYDPRGSDAYRQMESDQGKASWTSPGALWRRWQHVGSHFENANRMAIAKSILDAGGSMAEAAYQALDIMNFSMHGDGKSIRALTTMVPFMNARMQGLYRLWRGRNAPSFYMRGAAITAATLALMAMNWDDDRYWELEEFDRDANWHFWLGDQHFKIAKPFEVGQIFGTIWERSVATVFGKQSAKLFAQRLGAMVRDTFAMDPTPQLVKPIIEQYANRNSFTGRPIENQSMTGLLPEDRYMPWTSETARLMAQVPPDWAPEWMRSPVRLEALLRGYLGTVGMYALSVADQVSRPLGGYGEPPAMALKDAPVVRRFYAGDSATRTRYEQPIYELLDQANKAYRSVAESRRRGMLEEAGEIQMDKAELLAARGRLTAYSNQMRAFNMRERLIWNSTSLSDDEKADQIKQVRDQRNTALRQAADMIEELEPYLPWL